MKAKSKGKAKGKGAGGRAPGRGQFKIQLWTTGGWADVKSSVDGGPYVVDKYKTRREARAELEEMAEAGGYGARDMRVVPASAKADSDMYG